MQLTDKTLASSQGLGGLSGFLTRLAGGNRFTVSDVLTYGYLFLGTIVMFGPVVWLVMSSFKPLEELYEPVQSFLPYQQQTVTLPGYDQPLPLFEVYTENGETVVMAQVSRTGVIARMIDPQTPNAEPIMISIRDRAPLRYISFSLENYIGALESYPFVRYLGNSLFVTISATALTLLVNSMAAFGLSKYRFRGRDMMFLLMISTLLVPVTVILIPAFFVVSGIGWQNNLLGLIIPGAATPTGVFLLRQYMLTIPDELLDAARVDGATEWRVFWQVVLPLAAPALAVLTIFSIMWRWNDFLWPLIVVTRQELFTLPVGLRSFQGELNVQWHYVLAMTVLTLLPITVVFAFLQRFITTGVATTGMK